jgi:macrodomain Ter protein organizer (MatP/YcbG family)
MKKVVIKKPTQKKTPTPKSADAWVNDRQDTRRFTIDMPVLLHAKLKIRAAEEYKTMAEIMIELLEEELK